MVVGLTEQEIVGGSNSFTVKLAVDSVAVCQGFKPSLPVLPSLALQLTVCWPGDSDAVFTCAVVPLAGALMPSPEIVVTRFSFGSCDPGVKVAVTGSPGNTELGLTEQATVNCGGGASVPTCTTNPALKRAELKLPRPPKVPGPQLICMYS